MFQLLQFYLLRQDAGADITQPTFEILTGKQPLTWKYRGQVLPTHSRVTTELEVIEAGQDEAGRYAVADARLWVDGRLVYQAANIGVRVVPGGPAEPREQERARERERVIDPAVDTWIGDHCPTWTIPALPMMSTLDLLARAAAEYSGRDVVAVRDLELRRWLPVTGPVRVKTQVAGDGSELSVTLLAWREAATPALSRFEPMASATVRVGTPGARPAAFEPLTDAETVDDVYTSGSLFHGPRFRYLSSLRRNAAGASGVLDAGRGAVPRGQLHQGLLDAATHTIPHARLCEWSPEISPDVTGYPHRIARFEQFEPLPDDGEVRVEARFAGFYQENRRFPVIDLQLSRAGRVFVALSLVDGLMPFGLRGATPGQRLAFMHDRRYADGIGLSRTTDAGITRISHDDADRYDWLVGTVACIYNLPPGSRGRDHLAGIAIRDHVGRQARVHPSAVQVNGDLSAAWPACSRPRSTTCGSISKPRTSRSRTTRSNRRSGRMRAVTLPGTGAGLRCR